MARFKLRDYPALDIVRDFFVRKRTDKKILVFDIETNGLYFSVSKLHCAVTHDIVSNVTKRYTHDMYFELLEDLSKADVLVGHNAINYDVPTLRKLFPFWNIKETAVIDTLVLSRLIFSDIANRDVIGVRRWRAVEEWHRCAEAWKEYRRLREEHESLSVQNVADELYCPPQPQPPSRKLWEYPAGWVLPPKLLGSHSLKAWGYRLGELKGNYGEQDDAWDEYNEDMLDYCEQDVVVATKLLARLYKEKYSEKAIQLEHEIAWLMAQQERNGFMLDVKAAEEMYFELLGEREDIRQRLVEQFGQWYEANGVTTPKRSMVRQGVAYTKGAPYTKLKVVTFNPASRHHCARVLQQMGVVFTEFTETGQPKISETTLSQMDIAEAQDLRTFFMLNKLIGMLAEGKQAWLKAVHKDGFLHGSVNANGAVTGRATHANPNLAQVPSGKTALGKRCRGLFTVPTGWVLVGADASGLELRCLANAMFPWDKGAYAREVVAGDVHWRNAQGAGFTTDLERDKHSKIHDDARNAAKRFIYAFLYGAGDELIGLLVGYTQDEYEAWKAKGAHLSVIKSLEKRKIKWTREMVCRILKGKEVKATFLKGLPALKALITDCKKHAKEDGYLVGLDGRHIHCRSAHSALNALLQSMGALVCKLWCVVVNQMMLERGFNHGWQGDYAFCAWVHDEIQVACRNEDVARALREVVQEAMDYVAEDFGFKCPLGTESAVGQTWRETH